MREGRGLGESENENLIGSENEICHDIVFFINGIFGEREMA